MSWWWSKVMYMGVNKRSTLKTKYKYCAWHWHNIHVHSLLPRLSPCAIRFSVLQAMESWAGPGNEATMCTGSSCAHKHIPKLDDLTMYILLHKLPIYSCSYWCGCVLFDLYQYFISQSDKWQWSWNSEISSSIWIYTNSHICLQNLLSTVSRCHSLTPL